MVALAGAPVPFIYSGVLCPLAPLIVSCFLGGPARATERHCRGRACPKGSTCKWSQAPPRPAGGRSGKLIFLWGGVPP